MDLWDNLSSMCLLGVRGGELSSSVHHGGSVIGGTYVGNIGRSTHIC